MSRPYSDKFLIGLQSADEDRVGIQLAKVCVESSLPLLYVAEYFGSLSMSTVYVFPPIDISNGLATLLVIEFTPGMMLKAFQEKKVFVV